MPDIQKSIKRLYVLTPFKDKNSKLLKKTIKSLSKNRTNTRIYQLIIYDKSSKELILKLKKETITNKNRNYYFIKFIQANSDGIYSALNEGLNLIPQNSYYMVIGAGDLFSEIKSSLKTSKNKIIFLPYKLSCSREKRYIKEIRNIYGGMPYCHNAIAYMNDGSKYESNYKISADYDHFLKYVKNYNLTKQIMLQSFQECIYIEFESRFGLSSQSRISRNLENIKIIYRFFGFTQIILYCLQILKKVINNFWKEN